MRLAILLIIIITACAGAQAQESVRVNFHRDLSESLNLMQFVDRIQRPCSTGNVVAATVIANPNNSGNVAVTTCQGGNFTINGSTIVPGGGLADPGANGYVVRTALNTTTARTLTGTANQVIISNGTGVAGNSVFSLPQSIATTSFPQFAGLGLNTTAGTAGQLKFGGTTSGIITVHPAAVAGTWDFTLPTTDGNSGEFLQTNGSGVTSWQPVTAGVTCAGCTNNFVPKTTGAGTLGDSRISDDGAFISLEASAVDDRVRLGDFNDVNVGSYIVVSNQAVLPRVYISAGEVGLGPGKLDIQGGAFPRFDLVAGNNSSVGSNGTLAFLGVGGTYLELDDSTNTARFFGAVEIGRAHV